MTFEAFGLPSQILKNITQLGYSAPTPIQSKAVPVAMQSRDLMGLAQTGTGKTAAFLLPIITRLMKKPQVEGAPRRAYRRPRCLVLAPTRELAEQIHESALDLGKGTGVRSTTVYGGVNMNRQITALRNGADIVVACPGRLLDHMGQRTVDLSKVEVLVLDEADQMFDMGFLPDIKKILAGLPRERQTMLFSATMPDAIRQLATDILREPETVSVGHSAPAETVSHAIYPVSQHLKTALLMEMLKRFGKGSVLVFTRTKHRAKRVAEQLSKVGVSATALQGNLSQNRRKEAMDGFRDGRFRVMVATDIAARGIDVSLVEHVVNYDVPSTPETYTHRIGRTGRAERTGEAHTFVSAEDMSMVRAIERLLREPLTRKKLEGFDYNAAAPARDTEFARPPLQPRNRGMGAPKPQRPKQRDGRADGPSAGQSAGPDSREGRRDDRRPQGGEGRRTEGRNGDGRGSDRRDGRRHEQRADSRGGQRPAPQHGHRDDRREAAYAVDEHGDVNGNRPQPGDDIYARESVGGLFARKYRYGAPRDNEHGDSRPAGGNGHGQRRERRDDQRQGQQRNNAPRGSAPRGNAPRGNAPTAR